MSVNPVDTKVRIRQAPQAGGTNVLGWDAAGVVVAVGSEAHLFKPGDVVWYAVSLVRPGTNAELHLVDERIVGKKPKSLDFAQAAALPLTTITAWELLFDRFGVLPGKRATDKSLLIIGAAGGVGSILTQLARRLTAMTVIGTASRKETADWVLSFGAQHVIDHTKPLSAELKRIGIAEVTHVASLTQTDAHFPEIVESLAPQGKFGLIDDPKPIDINQLKRKSISLHWELMFTRSLFGTADMIAQHRLLSRGGRACRRRRDSHHLRRALRPHQRSKLETCPRANRERQGQGQNRVGGILKFCSGEQFSPTQISRIT